MIEYYKENIQLYIILFVWLVAGIVGGPAIYVVLPVTLLLMRQRGMYEELLIGFFFILILSDSLDEQLFFAKTVKNIYMAFLAVVFLFDTNSFQPMNKLYKIFIPFFLFSIITIFNSVNDPFFSTGLQKTISFFLSFLVIPNFILKLYREEGVLFLKRFMFFCFTTLFLGFVFKYLAHDIAYLGSGRYRGVMGNPNGLGIYAFLIFIVFYVINDFFSDLFSKHERIMIYVSIILSILMTNSRNAVLAVLMFYLFQVFFNKSPFLGFIFFLLALYTVELINANLALIITTLGLEDFFRLSTLEDGSGRYIAWAFAWKQIQHNFFIGKGFAYNEFYMRQHYIELGKLGHQGGIHNSFLTFWMDQGLIGLIIYLRSYILMFIKAAQKTRFAFPILFSISFTAMFESWLVASLSALAFLAMFIFTIITSEEIAHKEVDETESEDKSEITLAAN